MSSLRRENTDVTEKYRAEKLIRDLIPGFFSPEEQQARIRQVDNQAITPFVIQKVLEEAIEVMEAATNGDKGELSTELADLLEVMERLI
jgi:predicted house-cleaning noncanonical NTP pyrophosphatase (MazG superfamily)